MRARFLLLLVAGMVAATACSASSPTRTRTITRIEVRTVTRSPSATTTKTANNGSVGVKVGQPFRVGGFRVTVTSIALGVRLREDRADGGDVLKPKNGQFCLVTFRLYNASNRPLTYPEPDSQLYDTKRRVFSETTVSSDYVYVPHLASAPDELQPDTSETLRSVFDLPPSVTGVYQILFRTIDENSYKTTTWTSVYPTS